MLRSKNAAVYFAILFQNAQHQKNPFFNGLLVLFDEQNSVERKTQTKARTLKVLAEDCHFFPSPSLQRHFFTFAPTNLLLSTSFTLWMIRPTYLSHTLLGMQLVAAEKRMEEASLFSVADLTETLTYAHTSCWRQERPISLKTIWLVAYIISGPPVSLNSLFFLLVSLNEYVKR